MSYAQVAASGPRQPDEEKRAPVPPSIISTESASTSSLIDVDTDSVHTVPSDFSSQAIQTETQANRIDHEAEQIESRTRSAKDKAKDAKKSKKGRSRLEENSDNPVFIGNAVAVVALSAGLGFGAYRKYAAGELTWKLVGGWMGVVGAFAFGDYWLSSYLFKNKYPPKK